MPASAANAAGAAAGSALAPAAASAMAPTSLRQEHMMDIYTLVQRVRSEFLEMPGLRLTPAQAARLWQLDLQICEQVIDSLVRTAFLRWTPTGAIVRA